jgi:hypothetical protein
MGQIEHHLAAGQQVAGCRADVDEFAEPAALALGIVSGPLLLLIAVAVMLRRHRQQIQGDVHAALLGHYVKLDERTALEATNSRLTFLPKVRHV